MLAAASVQAQEAVSAREQSRAGAAPLGLDDVSLTIEFATTDVSQNQLPQNQVPQNQVPQNQVPQNQVPQKQDTQTHG
ncbi:MAG: hypothetical protein WAN06_14265, partial [Candidatus Sulfotelmatobacter sp.]